MIGDFVLLVVIRWISSIAIEQFGPFTTYDACLNFGNTIEAMMEDPYTSVSWICLQGEGATL